jgi:hypothetical protein
MAVCRTVEKVIRGKKWQITQMPPSEALLIWAQILQVASGVIGPMMTESKGLEHAIKTGFGSFGDAIAKFLPPAEFLELSKMLAHPDFVRLEGTPVNFEIDFAGDDLVVMFQVAAAVLEVNYAQFFSDGSAGGLLARIVARLSTPGKSPESPRESTSTSGGQS